MSNSWEKLPTISHLASMGQNEYVKKLQLRKRLRDVRYNFFRLQTAHLKNEACDLELPDGFIEYWMQQKPEYKLGMKVANHNDVGAIQQQPGVYVMFVPVKIPEHLQKFTVVQLGGVKSFAITWDVDPQLRVFLRRTSVWDEWDMKLKKIAPRLDDLT